MAGGREGLHTNVGKKEEVCARRSRGRRAGGRWTHRQPIHKVYWGSLMSRHSLPPPSPPQHQVAPSAFRCITHKVSRFITPLPSLSGSCLAFSANWLQRVLLPVGTLSLSSSICSLSFLCPPPSQSCIINLQPMLFIE